MKRLDRAAALITAAGLALCAATAFVYKDALDSPDVEIVVNGEVVERLPLSGEPRDITVRAGGGFNVVRVGEGRAAVVSADCPDRTCVKNGEISRPGEGAVCLPHRVVVRVTGGRGGEVDAVSR